MEVRVLRYFLAVAREESISGAAQALFVTQPTLSRQMMELEQELGKRLFLRGKRKIPLTERLDRGLLDFGLLIESVNLAKYDFIRLPVQDIWGVLMRKDSPLAAKERIGPEDLLGLPLLCSNQSLVHNELAGWMGERFKQARICTTYNLQYNAALMVEEGMGYALCLHKIINTAAGSPLCFRPLEPKLEVGLDLVWKKDQVFSKAAAKFLEYMQREIKAMTESTHA